MIYNKITNQTDNMAFGLDKNTCVNAVVLEGIVAMFIGIVAVWPSIATMLVGLAYVLSSPFSIELYTKNTYLEYKTNIKNEPS